MSPLIAALAGALVVGGLIGIVVGFRPAPIPVAKPKRTTLAARLFGSRVAGMSKRTRATLLIGVGVGLLLAIFKGWVFAVLLIPAAIVGLPKLLSVPQSGTPIERLEAMEDWARSLSGKITAGSELRTALQRSLKTAPAELKPEISRLVNRLRSQTTSTEQALRLLAEELNDSTGDLLVFDLIGAARGKSTGLVEALDEVAETVGADVKQRRQIAADQEKPRGAARITTVITLIVLGVLAFTGDYVKPYVDSALGQLVLIALLSAYVGALLWLRRMAVAEPLPRFLDLNARNAA